MQPMHYNHYHSKKSMKKLFSHLSFTAILFSCSKARVNAHNGQVNVRLINATVSTLQSAKISTVNYGNISVGSITVYKTLTDPIYAAFCTHMVNDTETYAGYGVCGSPMPAPFEPGYYTFRIIPDASGYYRITVIKQ